jgi:hypothetical protein
METVLWNSRASAISASFESSECLDSDGGTAGTKYSTASVESEQLVFGASGIFSDAFVWCNFDSLSNLGSKFGLSRSLAYGTSLTARTPVGVYENLRLRDRLEWLLSKLTLAGEAFGPFTVSEIELDRSYGGLFLKIQLVILSHEIVLARIILWWYSKIVIRSSDLRSVPAGRLLQSNNIVRCVRSSVEHQLLILQNALAETGICSDGIDSAPN